MEKKLKQQSIQGEGRGGGEKKKRRREARKTGGGKKKNDDGGAEKRGAPGVCVRSVNARTHIHNTRKKKKEAFLVPSKKFSFFF